MTDGGADLPKLAAVFVVTFAAVVAVAGGASVALNEGYDRPEDVGNAQFSADNATGGVFGVNATADGEDDEIEIDSFGSQKTVLVDTAHGNDFSRGDISPLTQALAEDGHEVRVYDGSDPEGALDDADAFVSVRPQRAFREDEAEALKEFVDDGGRVMVAVDTGGGGTGSGGEAFEAGVGEAVSALGVYSLSGYLYNVRENENNYLSVYAEPADDAGGTLTDGVDRVVLRGAVAVESKAGSAVLRATNGTRSGVTRRASRYPVVAREDNTVIVGDAAFLEPQNAFTEDNEEFIGNIAEFLVSGSGSSISSSGDTENDTDLRVGEDFGEGFGGEVPSQPPSPDR